VLPFVSYHHGTLRPGTVGYICGYSNLNLACEEVNAAKLKKGPLKYFKKKYDTDKMPGSSSSVFYLIF
jgi:hypothetical protein